MSKKIKDSEDSKMKADSEVSKMKADLEEVAKKNDELKAKNDESTCSIQ
jgi:hypothetical protein